MKTILFTYRVLSSESEESLKWLFKSCIECMGEGLKAIIIDQDPTMKKGFAKVFPNTFHRLCKLHITHKMCDKVGNVYRDKDTIKESHEILNLSQTIDIFE